MYGNCFGVHFLAGFIFLLITRRVLPERIIFSYLSQNFQKIFSRIYTEMASLKIVTECFDSRLLHSALRNLFDFYASICFRLCFRLKSNSRV